jgi:hypothetical protein
MGGFDLAKLPALEGIDIADVSAGLDVDLAGVVGADLLAFFRVTFADEGRFIWIEPDPSLLGNESAAAREPGRASSGITAPPSGPAKPDASAKPPPAQR